jgi:hypothetical protein
MMTEVTGLARLDELAQRYGTRPSAIAGVADPYLAYCVDEACALASGDWRPPKEPDPPPPEMRMINGMPMMVGIIRRAED